MLYEDSLIESGNYVEYTIETINEDLKQALDLNKRLKNLSESLDYKKNNSHLHEEYLVEADTLWQKFKNGVKQFVIKMKDWLKKIIIFARNRISMAYNTIKNTMVETQEVDVIRVEDYKALIDHIMRIDKLFLRMMAAGSSLGNMISECTSQYNNLKDKWANMRGNKKLIKINKDQCNQYITLGKRLEEIFKDSDRLVGLEQQLVDRYIDGLEKKINNIKAGDPNKQKLQDELNAAKKADASTRTYLSLVSAISNSLLNDIGVTSKAFGKGRSGEVRKTKSDLTKAQQDREKNTLK